MLNDLQTLLDDFSKIPANVKSNPTFMQIAGYPHYENVCSNLLAFFLDPAREHGFKDLVLKALLSCLGYNLNLSNVEVEREVSCKNGRIDILITSDTHVIVIENKIYHQLNNPLEGYEKEAQAIANGRDCIYIILGLNKNYSGNLGGFKVVTYAELFAKIRAMLGGYITVSNSVYLVRLFEFIETIESLISGGSMNKDQVDFFANNDVLTTNFIDTFNQMKRELRAKVERVNNALTNNSKKGLWREANKLSDCVFQEFDLNKNTIAIDCHVTPAGWEITIFPRKGPVTDLEEHLDIKGIPFKSGPRLILKNYPYNHLESDIAVDLDDFINKL